MTHLLRLAGDSLFSQFRLVSLLPFNTCRLTRIIVLDNYSVVVARVVEGYYLKWAIGLF